MGCRGIAWILFCTNDARSAHLWVASLAAGLPQVGIKVWPQHYIVVVVVGVGVGVGVVGVAVCVNDVTVTCLAFVSYCVQAVVAAKTLHRTFGS